MHLSDAVPSKHSVPTISKFFGFILKVEYYFFLNFFDSTNLVSVFKFSF